MLSLLPSGRVDILTCLSCSRPHYPSERAYDTKPKCFCQKTVSAPGLSTVILDRPAVMLKFALEY